MRKEVIGNATLYLGDCLEILPTLPNMPDIPISSMPPTSRMASIPVVRDYQSAQSHSAAQLQQALRAHGGNQSRAAQAVGLTVRQFSYRLRKMAQHNVANL